ncbi:MAG: L-seryl-tRNA(Sec) selenium transferase [Tindallia sp. MSAO_Bac2]|nr:MAG: L-seryl-tRNA(Sec) selenium transferase [Tindallia sp. MSAO_Bac2]
MADQHLLRKLPKVDDIISHQAVQQLLKEIGRETLLEVTRETINDLRSNILNSEPGTVNEGLVDINETVKTIENKVRRINEMQIQKVVNGTGVILHTNLGRAPLGAYTQDILQSIAGGYSNLELDMTTGKRGSRYQHMKELLLNLTGAEDAIVVNNNAGAVLLVLSAIAKGKEVIISRGELVEIGGSFRVPEVMEQSGAKLVEVGATNKCYPKDYENAITEDTGALLKVHRSNFKLIGFTRDTSFEELMQISEKKGFPVINDLGSGLFIDLQPYSYPYEPTVQEVVASGCDIVTFSGDKLLGGTQAGIIVGKKKWIQKIASHPLTRALRVDKLTLSALEATLKKYLQPEKAISEIPVLKMMTVSHAELDKKAETFRDILPERLNGLNISVEKSYSQVGGGSFPGHQMESRVIAFRGNPEEATKLERFLRTEKPAVMGRLSEGAYFLDVRTLFESDLSIIVKRLNDWSQRSDNY